MKILQKRFREILFLTYTAYSTCVRLDFYS